MDMWLTGYLGSNKKFAEPQGKPNKNTAQGNCSCVDSELQSFSNSFISRHQVPESVQGLSGEHVG